MITLKLSQYTERELHYLQHLCFYSQQKLLPCEKDCKSCDYKHVCYDIDLILPYIHEAIKCKSTRSQKVHNKNLDKS